MMIIINKGENKGGWADGADRPGRPVMSCSSRLKAAKQNSKGVSPFL